ncbi:NERD domain-containing protein [Planococcus antarcticus DSM 14505]|uniref:NERD domain-containing protein n=1 Tax=Planococcus antarcticus DSM 14505 TaxID=1185653 RepID=A0A1C7DIP3_9BACL|nr:nuclease-related domain-containing protein [Planococcus antarcticus]ANU11366.1 nuclease [Planococcus antarcticus DSM 14505]EIM05676.1 NERD domain-containing protein [Planococcus antarcticus DSM 14505]
MSKKEIVLLSQTDLLERLLYRLPEIHPKRPFLQIELYRTAAGKRGEDRLERKLIEFSPEENYRFLRNVCLSPDDWKVQMDVLLLTERGVIFIESKNSSGQLYFDNQTSEFSRTDLEGARTVMENPASQLNKNIRFLTKFFKQHKINLPIEGLVVFTSKHCEFMTNPKNIHVCKTYQLIDYLFHILQDFPEKNTRPNLSEIDKLFQKAQTPYIRFPLCQLYAIEPNELRVGIFCYNCKNHRVIRKYKYGWMCELCETIDPLALENTIREYFSLVHKRLSNKKLRQFCNLESPYVVSRLLTTFDFEIEGDLRNRTYQLKNKG